MNHVLLTESYLVDAGSVADFRPYPGRGAAL